ncbi:MAG: hypothetical protein M0Q22_06600 [Sulfuritalea sp.]|jgi:hypothetical protein|nr:hypothetical protein [Sulfuritalea sp.]
MTNISNDFRAAIYIRVLLGGYRLRSGIAYQAEAQKLMLDFSEQSLKRIDKMLDGIRRVNTRSLYEFLADPKCQNLIFALAFYSGKVIEMNSGSECTWLTEAEFRKTLPLPSPPGDPRYCFIAHFSEGLYRDPMDAHGGNWFPLVSILGRLFDDDPMRNSVWYSAGLFMELNESAE